VANERKVAIKPMWPTQKWPTQAKVANLRNKNTSLIELPIDYFSIKAYSDSKYP
jgi:hypothetical protein